MIEADYPIRIEHYGFAADTGGPGLHRGGLGVVREYRMLTDDVYFGVRSDKAVHAPHGLFGGSAGARASNEIRGATHGRNLPPMPMVPITLNCGEIYRHVMAGGGGFGEPWRREPQRVLDDVKDGRVSRDQAQSAYGVVIDDDLRVNEPATEALRTALRAAPPS
jgi:N-methylhydantoinase B